MNFFKNINLNKDKYLLKYIYYDIYNIIDDDINKIYNKLLNEKNTLNEIQNYIKEVIKIRGFSEQKVQDKMLLLLEETGELAKAIRKTIPEASVDYEKIENYTDIEEEVADVFIVLVSICNRLNINLYDAIIKKEEKNIKRQWKLNVGENNEQ